MWGQPPRERREKLALRFTPTRVGTTKYDTTPSSAIPVHPHACGDNARGAREAAWGRGSPPRVWGQHGPSRAQRIRTPVHPHACGDNAQYWVLHLWKIQVHPHACGDNAFIQGRLLRIYGSPPRVWGQHLPEVARLLDWRFTPTRVGTTLPIRLRAQPPTVHPHACGDNDWVGKAVAVSPGSPPRVWGQRVGGGEGVASESVHPHACGDNARMRVGKALTFGSPPRVWGQRLPEVARLLDWRFTPTRVGTTSSRTRRPGMYNGSPPRVWGQLSAPTTYSAVEKVHPHACGDN